MPPRPLLKSSQPAKTLKKSRASDRGQGAPVDVAQAKPPIVPLPEESRRRVVIEHISPSLEGGFAIKRTPGERVIVEADLFADGHDNIAGVVRYRPVTKAARAAWKEVALEPVDNDRWRAWFVVTEVGRYEYALESWVDHFASWQRALHARVAAAQEGLDSEFLEGAALIRDAASRTRSEELRQWLTNMAAALEDANASIAERAALALSRELAERMRSLPDRRFSTASPVHRVIVDRERARFSTWYEMFPRSAGPDPTRSATFREAASRIPEVAAMGFDVLYLPPIHPIGKTHRKGRNNSLTAQPGEPGSPWAIGGEEGGHTAVEPGLGTIDDFRWFREQAEAAGMEIALDLAYQASPDHPYTRAHPEWFRQRPDGTLKYAENPPKKYQDIYPINFESEAWPQLWMELRDVVLFWVDQGVRIFRVDNPHTKPFAFWEWMIADVQARDPGVIFLSEAFTRPKVMRRLAKLGFTQSYTYFTWRNSKKELEDYFTELAQTEMREYFRPNLFANTPDILHEFLQSGGPPAFRIRLLLAATLGANYGIYSGFEIFENRPAKPGSEEYLDSEKYQFRQWDFKQPGNLSDLITRVNAIRRAQSALQYNDGLRFHLTSNDEIIAYSKVAPFDFAQGRPFDAAQGKPWRGPRIFTVVSLNPHEMREGTVCLALDDYAVPDGERYTVRDLLTDLSYTWSGAWNYVKLDPSLPGHIFLIERPSA
jgi:starch synthase (maltosyl-transferring)